MCGGNIVDMEGRKDVWMERSRYGRKEEDKWRYMLKILKKRGSIEGKKDIWKEIRMYIRNEGGMEGREE